MKKLAINGGNPIIEHKMPARIAFGVKEQKMISKVINFYKAQNADPGYQGFFEEEYCKVFSNYLGGGYSDAVATGTIAVYIAIAALKLEKNSEVLCSPITDPGTISAITLNGLIPKLVDSEKNSYNTSFLKIIERINSKTKAIVLVHSAGYSIDMKKIIELAKSKKIKIIEDCSQAHGAEFNNKKVGTFGDVSAFS
ncbi:MAG: glutamine--scyllo-inositol aminotransferase, partial [Rickettsiales bacterium]|nr:glutamine--scyllo-inositol aminotransferase [Rickettsiales bacterium]